MRVDDWDSLKAYLKKRRKIRKKKSIKIVPNRPASELDRVIVAPISSGRQKSTSVEERITTGAMKRVLEGTEKCYGCGLQTMIYRNGLCWECYKDETNKMWE